MATVTQVRRALWHLRHGGFDALRRHRARERAARTGQPRAVARSSARGGVDFEPWQLPEPTPRRPSLRVATILDDFSGLAFSYEWESVPLSRKSWKEALASQAIDMLFVESAWSGNSGEWRYQLTGASGPKEEFINLVEEFNQQGIPTVFWNKEDPTHYDDFIEAAEHFKYVFTTDSNMVPRYRRDLAHDNIGILQFAAAPAIHNPARARGAAKDRDVAFGGMYFSHRHPERREQLHMLLDAAVAVGPRMKRGLEIFSRQLGADSRYQFPTEYSKYVVGSLPYVKMLTAYRGYKIFLNVNTVTNSPTMCARRVFEISASGTTVVSTPNPAIESVFPDEEIPQVATQEEAEHTLRALVASPELRERQIHRAQRIIWNSHTYSHRADQILNAVGLRDHIKEESPRPVSALVSSIRPQQLEYVLETIGSQQGVDVQLCFLAHGWEPDVPSLRARAKDHGINEVTVISRSLEFTLGDCLNALVESADGYYAAKIDDDDFYGPQYLGDLLNAIRYSGAEVVGKYAHYVHLVDQKITALRFPAQEHKFSSMVMGATICAATESMRENPFPSVSSGEDSAFLRSVSHAGGRIYSADRFNFANLRRGTGHTWQISDREVLAAAVVQVYGSSIEHVVN